jgi:hypothetical protein
MFNENELEIILWSLDISKKISWKIIYFELLTFKNSIIFIFIKYFLVLGEH